jgi:hypothetical protein
MSLKIPRPPSGSHPLAVWCRAVCECLRQLQPRPGQNVWTDVTTRGTTRVGRAKQTTEGGKTGPCRYA